MKEPSIYVLRVGSKLVGFTHSDLIAQWWSNQEAGRQWMELQFMTFSDNESERIVNEVIAPKTP